MALCGLKLWEKVSQQVKRTPDVVAVISDAVDRKSSIKLTYKEMWQRSVQICDELQKNGHKNEIIGVCIVPGENMPSTLLGIMQGGSAYFPFGVDGIAFVHKALQILQVKALLFDHTTFKSFEPYLLKLHCHIVHSTFLRSLGLQLVGISLDSAGVKLVPGFPDLAYCITTSGTTGAPTVVRVPHSCIVPNVLDFRKIFQPGVGDVIFLTSPLTFDPSVIDIFMTLTSGASLLLVSETVKMSPQQLMSSVFKENKISILQMTPFMFRNFNTVSVRRSLLSADSSLRILAFGGEMFPDREYLKQCMDPNNDTSIYNVYGITELSCWATVQLVRPAKGHFMEDVPVGKALTGTKIKVLDEGGSEITCGTGHIWIGGSDRVCLLNDEDGEVLKQSAIWRKTGDLGRIDNDGNIFCLGRIDRQFKRNGKRVNLHTLEHICQEILSVQACRAVQRDGRLYLFCQSHVVGAREESKLLDKVKAHLTFTLPSHYFPDGITLVRQFPVTSHGKLNELALLFLQKNRLEVDSTVPVEMWLSDLWQETVRGNTKPSAPDHFLHCGGDSLKAVQLVNKVEEVVGHGVPNLLDTLLSRTWSETLALVEQTVDQLRDTGVCSLANNKFLSSVQLHEEKEGVHSQSINSTAHQTETGKESLSDDEIENKSLTDHQELKAMKLASSKRNYVQISDKAEQTDSNSLAKKRKTFDNTEINQMPEAKLRERVVINSFSRAAGCIHGKTSSVDHCSSCSRQQHFSDCRCFRSKHKMESSFEDKTIPNSDFLQTDCVSSMKKSTMKVYLTKRWAVDTSKCVDASPLAAYTSCGKLITFIGSHSHKFFAIDLEQGEVLWVAVLGDRIEGSAAISPCGQFVVVGCYDCNIYILKAGTGEVKWKVKTGDVVKCSPKADPSSQHIFCGSHDGFLYALHCQDQRISWKAYCGGGGVFASPVISTSGNHVIAATLHGFVTALSIAKGEILWSVSLGKPVFSSPVVMSGWLFVATVDNTMFCLSCRTGQQQWKYKTAAPIFSSPVITNLKSSEDLYIMFGCHDSYLYCLSCNGTLLWKKEMPATIYASPYVSCLCTLSLCACQICTLERTDSIRNIFVAQDSLGFCKKTSVCEDLSHITTQTLLPDKQNLLSQDDKLLLNQVNCKKVGSILAVQHSTEDEHLDDIAGIRESQHFKTHLKYSAGNQLVKGNDLAKSPLDSFARSIRVNTISDRESLTSDLTKCSECCAQGRIGCHKENDTLPYRAGDKTHSILSVHSDFLAAAENEKVCKFEGQKKKPFHHVNQLPKSHFVVCASTDGTVTVLCAETGEEMGGVCLPGEVFSSPVLVGNNLLMGCRDNFVYCYNIRDLPY